MKDKVFIALQDNEEARPIVDAIAMDNPEANIEHPPGMVRVEAPGHLVINRGTVSSLAGRDWDVQELQVQLISLGGNIDEDDDKFELAWHSEQP